MSNEPEFTLSFRIYSRTMSIDDIEKIVGVKSEYNQKCGDVIIGRRIHELNMCEFFYKSGSNIAFREAAKAISININSMNIDVKKMVDCKFILWGAIHASKVENTLNLPVELMSALANVNAEATIAIYKN